MDFTTVEDAVCAFAHGEFVIVVDSNEREDEGDLVIAAEKVTPEKIAFMVRHTSGLICAPMTAERLDALRIPLMLAHNTEKHGTAFTVSVDARQGTTTGISAADRAGTLCALANPASVAADFLRPGHVFPLRARAGGVLERAGHTEAVIDLARLAGVGHVGVICELVRDDGEMRRYPDLVDFSRLHRIPLLLIEDLIGYRMEMQASAVSAGA